MDSLLQLAERCEAAEGPDRELDRDIEIAIQNLNGRGHDDPRDDITARQVLVSHGAKLHNYEIVAFSGISLHTPRAYTASIDDALKLVSGEWRTIIETGPSYSSVELVRGYGVKRERHFCTLERADDYVAGLICAAALRARHSQGVSDNGK